MTIIYVKYQTSYDFFIDLKALIVFYVILYKIRSYNYHLYAVSFYVGFTTKVGTPSVFN
jgi:hypothetical protein